MDSVTIERIDTKRINAKRTRTKRTDTKSKTVKRTDAGGKTVKRTGMLLLCMVILFLAGGCTNKNRDLLTESGGGNSDFPAESGIGNSDFPAEQETGNGDFPAKAGSENKSIPAESETIFVYVCGCVANPAVYELKADMRVYEAIELAGGFSQDADAAALNLAENMTDGQKIYVPSVGEQVSSAGEPDTGQSSLINLNTATKEQLMTLSGIGEAKADSILSFREEQGAFSAIEDIMKIEGIKEGVFNKIKNDITV